MSATCSTASDPIRKDNEYVQPPRHGNDLLAPLIKDLLNEGRPVRLEVDGHSMTPFIRRGDIVTVQPRRDSPPSFGDVLVAADDLQRLTVHRHVGWTRGRIVLRGDCAPACDLPAPLESILGVVTRVERRSRQAWAGLGPERRLVAWLSRTGLLRRVANWLARRRAHWVASRNAAGLD